MVSERPNTNVVAVNSAEQDDQIVSVTVFQANRAEVKRRVAVGLQKGQNQILVERLPSSITGDSIRVEGTGNAVIFDVVYRGPYDHASPPSSRRTESDAVLSSRHHLELLQDELNVVRQQTKFLNSYGKTLHTENTGLDDLERFLDTFGSRQVSFAKRIQELEIQVAQAQEVYDNALVQTREDPRSARRRTSVTVTVLAESDGEAQLMLTYVVSNASWTPLYDVRASISSTSDIPSTISLHYRASITQTTGEDWSEVSLALSTASPQLGSSIPALSTWRIGFPSAPAPTLHGVRRRKKSASRFLDLMAEVEDDDEDEDEEDCLEVEMCGSIADEAVMGFRQAKVNNAQTLSATFGIPGSSNIPSDEGSHKVVVVVLDLEAELEWICVPRKKEHVFIRSQVINSSEFILLPGETSVFVDDNFVSKTRMEHVSPNDTFKVSLGVDSSIRITYPAARTLNRTGAESSLPFMAKGNKYSISSHSQRIVVRNSRATAVPALRVLDHVPVSTDAVINVNTLSPIGLESTRDEATSVSESVGLGKRKERPWEDLRAGVKARWADADIAGDGAVEWACEIQPNEEIHLDLDWEIKAPAGRSWVDI